MLAYEHDTIRLYDNRYVFIADNLVARFHPGFSEVEMVGTDPAVEKRVYDYLNTTFAIVCRPAVERITVPTLEPLPSNVLALSNPRLGDYTPEVREWVAANRPDEYFRRYGVRLSAEVAPRPISITVPDQTDDGPPPLTSVQKRLATMALKKAAYEASLATETTPDQ